MSWMGFETAILPERSKLGRNVGLRVQKIPDLATLVGNVFGAG